MTAFARIRQVLGSRALTLWIIGLFVIYYVTIAVWSKEAFANLVAGLANNILLQTFYVLLIVNSLIRFVHRLKYLWPYKAVFFSTLPLYAGIFLLLVSFFLSLNVRKSTWLLTGEGDVVGVPWERAPMRVVKIQSALQKDELKTEDSLIFSSEPKITLMDEKGAVHTVGAFPPRLVGSNYLHVLNFGIGPVVELRERGMIIKAGAVALRLTPFGKSDIFDLTPSPYKFSISILPNRIIKKGRETARQYDLRKPLYNVEIMKGDTLIAKGETDDGIAFDKTMFLTFHSPVDWIQLDVAYDPVLPLFVTGLLVTAAGMLFYPLSFFARRRWAKDSQLYGIPSSDETNVT